MTTEYTGDDFYCDIAIPRKIRLKIVHEDDWILAFHHTRPYWPVHIVVVPKKHITSLTTLVGFEQGLLARVMERIQVIASKLEEEHGAARVLTNLGTYQDSKHLHFHVSFGEPLAEAKLRDGLERFATLTEGVAENYKPSSYLKHQK